MCKCASLLFWFLWLVFYFNPPVIMSCCFVAFGSFFFVFFYGLSPDCCYHYMQKPTEKPLKEKLYVQL